MTIIRVDLVGTTLDAERKAELARRMIAAFCEIEVGADVATAHGGFAVNINEAPADSVFVGDAPMVQLSSANRAAIVTIQVMAGPWTDAMKASVFRALEEIIRDVVEMPKQGFGADLWMTLVEVPEGGWCVGGRTVSIRKIAGAFTEDRQQRIREYLANRPTPESRQSNP